MCFKQGLVGIIAIAMLTPVSGCGIHVGERKRAPESLVLNGDGYSCVGEIPLHVEQYFGNHLTADQITGFVRCLQHAFTSFAHLTRGRDESTYAPEEIRRFLQKYFLHDRQISDELLHQFMILKQAIVGGDTSHVSRADLAAIINILEDIRIEAINLKPHIPVLNPSLAQQQDPNDLGERLQLASEALRHSVQVFSNRLQNSKHDYAFADIQSLMVEFRKFVGWEEHFHQSHPPEQWVQLLQLFKELTVSPQFPEVVRPSEWVPLLASMSRWYSTFVQYEVGIQKQPLLKGEGLNNAWYFVNEVFAQVEEAINRQHNRTLTYKQIDRLIAALHDLDWLPAKLRVSSIEQISTVVIDRIFGDGTVPASHRHGPGLTLVNLANMKAEFYRWGYIQWRLDGTFNGEPATVRRVNGGVPSLQLGVGPTISPVLDLSILNGGDWESFIRVRDDDSVRIRPLFKPGSGFVQLLPASQLQQSGVDYSFYDLSMMNLARSVVSMIYRGYSSDSSAQGLWSMGIQSKELEQFYEDIREIGIDLGIIDRRNKNSGARAFIEGKLFTYSSKGLAEADTLHGEPRLSLSETMEYGWFLASGSRTAHNLYAVMMRECVNGPLDIYEVPKVERACVAQNLARWMQDEFTNMPLMVADLRHMNAAQLQDFSSIILSTAFSANSDQNWVERNEVVTLTVIVQYIESVITRYDIDGNGLLDNSEIEAAVPVFSGFIKKIAKDTMNTSLTDGEARGAFLYILANKVLPTTWSVGSVLWDNYVMGPTLRVDRTQLAQVFAAIIGKLMSTTPSAAPSIRNERPLSIPEPPMERPCESPSLLLCGP